MTSNPSQSGAIGKYMDGLPSWAKSLVALLTVPPLALAITGMLLNVNVGAQLDKYMELYFARTMEINDVNTNKIITALDGRVTALSTSFDGLHEQNSELMHMISGMSVDLGGITGRVTQIETWACEHSRTQGLRQDAPNFCEKQGAPQ